MMTESNGLVQGCGLLAAAVVSNGTLGAGDLDEGFGAILIGALLGAFCGLIFGLISAHVIRYAFYLAGKHVTGHLWTVCSVVVGAILFGWLAAAGGGEASEITAVGGIVEN